ncbi:DUF2591 domain-containing protein [Salmonella enterica subsp. enterica serovar Anatum]|uniref:NinX n=1 Tax=Salmonella phage vB_SenS_Sasha TaxID=1913114 RepID=A0A1P8DTT2_9CAUD|nr:NinX [Salmonella phage vB_SenS_Sasha]APU92907.1 NinX [Salmonella phage vB_SenS_Sergei]AXY86239.1 NinX [Salmonella phage Solent]EBA5048631.1 DUF2591 domain-containing protein [Salmonella enterica]KAA6846648.1 DUF2591 domain-containing protein [Salmonella enterica subsp. enterica serovar Anatum]APU92816.1 NinX [Salmonella phage vB_SenS_Sasha]
MTDYSVLSDREIDRLVLNVVYGIHANDKDIQGCWSRGGFKYTSNASDAWSIITENKISTMWMAAEKEWCAWANGELEEECWEWKYYPDDYYNHQNPLRAAMIVFLQMQENK